METSKAKNFKGSKKKLKVNKNKKSQNTQNFLNSLLTFLTSEKAEELREDPRRDLKFFELSFPPISNENKAQLIEYFQEYGLEEDVISQRLNFLMAEEKKLSLQKTKDEINAKIEWEEQEEQYWIGFFSRPYWAIEEDLDSLFTEWYLATLNGAPVLGLFSCWMMIMLKSKFFDDEWDY